MKYISCIFENDIINYRKLLLLEHMYQGSVLINENGKYVDLRGGGGGSCWQLVIFITQYVGFVVLSSIKYLTLY